MTLKAKIVRLLSGPGILAAAAIAVVALIGAALAAAQTAPQDKPLLAEQVFKNIRALRGIPVDDFLETMGQAEQPPEVIFYDMFWVIQIVQNTVY